jgi:hypothetical protein
LQNGGNPDIRKPNMVLKKLYFHRVNSSSLILSVRSTRWEGIGEGHELKARLYLFGRSNVGPMKIEKKAMTSTTKAFSTPC